MTMLPCGEFPPYQADVYESQRVNVLEAFEVGLVEEASSIREFLVTTSYMSLQTSNKEGTSIDTRFAGYSHLSNNIQYCHMVDTGFFDAV